MTPLRIEIEGLPRIMIMQFDEVWGANSSAQYFLGQLIKNGYAKEFLGSSVIDMGSGSGVMGFTVKIALGGGHVLFVDNHIPAVENALLNAEILGLKADTDYNVVLSDVFSNVPKGFTARILLGNLPMMPEIPGVEDPAEMSNQNGPDGNHVLLEVLRNAQKYIEPGGLVLINTSSRVNFEVTEQVLNDLYPNGWFYINKDERGRPGIDLSLIGGYYEPYLELWRLKTIEDGIASRADVFPRIYKLDQYGNPIVVLKDGNLKQTIFLLNDSTSESSVEKKYILTEEDGKAINLVCLTDNVKLPLTNEILDRIPSPVNDDEYHRYRMIGIRMP